jgi:hypothetical protein
MQLPSGKQKMMQLTVACDPLERFTPGLWAQPCTTWGEYLQKEKVRIESTRGRVAEIRIRKGQASLWVDRVAGFE